ncbi:hypothetical protein B0H16DRAFT_1459084 [Mycena metata]|nr:hypothetical protein B0H16DRAFT_1459084 [Mycena metata]
MIQGITPAFPLARCIVYFGKTPEPGVMVGVLRVWNPRCRGRHWSSARVDCDESTYLSTHPIFELWARAVPPGLSEPRIINGGQYAGVKFHEYASPYIDLGAAPTIPRTEWWRKERRIKEKFKSVYPDSHPDRLNSSPAFLCALHYLIACLACAHGVFALRSALHLAAEKVTRELEKAAAAPLLACTRSTVSAPLSGQQNTSARSASLKVGGSRGTPQDGPTRQVGGGGADTTVWGWGPDNTWVGPGWGPPRRRHG